MRTGLFGVLLVASTLGCRPTKETESPRDHAAVGAETVMGWVREIRRDIKLAARRHEVALFLLPVRRERTKTVTAPKSMEPSAIMKPPCFELVTKPRSVVGIAPTPGFEAVYANDTKGKLLWLRREGQQRAWVEVELPSGTPPIEGLMGFPLAASPLELLVGVRSNDQSELWTLVLANGRVTQAGPTDVSGPEYADSVAFLRAHHTPWCLDADRECLAVTEFEDQTFIDLAERRHAPSRRELLTLGGNLLVADVAWGNAEGSEVLVAAVGSPCLGAVP